MKPPQKKFEYEKIVTDQPVTGYIQDILYDRNHTFKGFGTDANGKKKEDTIGIAVRLVFSIDGYKFPHKTPWMSFSYSKKSNLFKKYISSLVQGATEYMDFDLDQLKGMRVNMFWKDEGEFQGIETIRPVDGKIKPLETVAAQKEPDETPF